VQCIITSWSTVHLEKLNVSQLVKKFPTYYYYYYYLLTYLLCGPSSSVGVVSDYGLDGPGSNPGGDEIFRPSRLARGATQPPVKWVPGLSRE